MSSAVADSLVMGNGNNKSGSPATLQLTEPLPTTIKTTSTTLKRKCSSDALSSAVAAGDPVDENVKRMKCTHTGNGVGVVGGGVGVGSIARNTIMITNNYGKNGELTPTSSTTTTTTTSNSSKITIVAHDADDHDGLRHSRPMVVDQINICINNHFSGDAALVTTTTTASATAKLPDLIKIQKTKTSKRDLLDTPIEPKVGYEAEVKQEIDVETELNEFTIKKEPADEEEVAEKERTENIQQVKTKVDNPPKASAIPHKFAIGEEVLVSRKTADESCFYLGILTVLRDDQALVQFEDGTNCWTSVGAIRRLVRQPNTIYCVICKTRELQSEEATVECVKCARAYHKVCLQMGLDELAIETTTTTTVTTQMGEKVDATAVNCLRCFKRLIGIDQPNGQETVLGRVEGETCRTRIISLDTRDNEMNSSNTGNATSVISHQVEVGAPSMDWFTKERRCDVISAATAASATPNGHVEARGFELELVDEDDDSVEGAGGPKDDEYCEYANGRRLRKRQQKRNYKDIQRRSGGGPATFPSQAGQSSATTWSCSSSNSSTTSLFAAATPSTSWCASSVVSSLGCVSSSSFTLEELRWAFLPKSHKFKRRSQKRAAVTVAEKKSVKVPYETTKRRASREYTREGGDSGMKVSGGAFETKTRLARGDKFVVRGKRQDLQGNVQYLIEWESGKA